MLKTVEDSYLKEDYQKSIDLLIERKSDLDSGLYHFNLGTLYAKQQLFPVARYHLEKAIKKGFYSSEVRNNLNYVVSHLELPPGVQIQSPFEKVLLKAKLIPGDLLISVTLLLLCFSGLLFKFKAVKKKGYLVFFLMVSFFPLIFSFYLDSIQLGVVIEDIEIREGPSKIYKSKAELKAGLKVITGDHYEDWFFIKYPLPVSGWVKRENLGLY